jgi:hypothetical protein
MVTFGVVTLQCCSLLAMFRRKMMPPSSGLRNVIFSWRGHHFDLFVLDHVTLLSPTFSLSFFLTSHLFLSLSLSLSLSLWLYSPLDLGRFQFLTLYTVGRTPRTVDESVAMPLPTHRHPCLKWDSSPRSPVFEQVKTVHALDRAATDWTILHLC